MSMSDGSGFPPLKSPAATLPCQEHFHPISDVTTLARVLRTQLKRDDAEMFMTRALWGVGSTSPMTRTAQYICAKWILRHGGEAQSLEIISDHLSDQNKTRVQES